MIGCKEKKRGGYKVRRNVGWILEDCKEGIWLKCMYKIINN